MYTYVYTTDCHGTYTHVIFIRTTARVCDVTACKVIYKYIIQQLYDACMVLHILQIKHVALLQLI